jgi:cardiolipin synthase
VGEARIIGGRLYLKARPIRSSLGLENTLDPTGLALGEVAARKAVMRLDDDAQRFEGVYRLGRQGGVERMRKSGWNAADNRVQLLVDGREAFPAFKRALASATRSIELQTFIYKDDSTGRAMAALLCERARAGVKVRVLVDAIGDSMGSCKKQMKAAGIEVVSQHGALDGIKNTIADLGRGLWNGLKRLFGGKKALRAREARGLQPRPPQDHRRRRPGRLLRRHEPGRRVRARVARRPRPGRGLGGRPAAPPLRGPLEGGGRQGPAAPGARLRGAPRRHGGRRRRRPPRDPPDIKTRYLRETERARSRILIENAYFLDDDVIGAMNAAVRRRVRTVLVIPGDEGHDVPLVRDAFAHVQNSVVRSGIELYKYQGPMVHTKVASWDGRVATVGSSNLDNMALQRLAEANIFVNDRRFALELEQRIFVVDLPRSKRCSETELSFWQQLKGSTLHMIRSFL